MDWYKITQNQVVSPPIPISDIGASNACHIDPNGIVYDVRSGSTHDEWVFAHLDFLKDKYGLLLRDKNNPDNYHNAIDMAKQGWIRHIRTYDIEGFDISGFDNLQALRIIEEQLFKVTQPNEDVTIDFFSWSGDNKEVEFKWTDFIESGDNFVDYVRGSYK